MKAWVAASVGGLVGCAAVLAVVLPKTIRRLEARGAALQAAAESGEGRTAFTRQVAALRGELDAYATAYADPLAQRAANDHMMTAYGINEQRVQKLERLARSLGVG